jgi:hypothetical protein
MAKIHVERIGGLANFGGAGSHIRSRGEIDVAALSAAEQRAVESLFQSRGQAKPSQLRDGFRYRLTRSTPSGIETVEVPEGAVPTAISQSVKDELA